MDKTDEAVFVGVRLRPFLGYESRQQCLTASGKLISVVGEFPDKKKKDFAFDCAMDSTDASKPDYVSQEKCYEMIGRRMVQHSISGYHTCLFCYGQTGSGKTFSFMGKKSELEQGLLPRLLRDLFGEVESLRSLGGQVQCRAQMLEVYNEKVRDLLEDKEKAKAPEIHVHPKVGVYVDGATDVQIETLEQLQKLLETGLSRASVAATMRNATSSRGHTLFRLLMEKHEAHTVVSSEVFCVDLAGRENEKTTKVTGENFVELTFINRSLMWLAQCIQGLGRQARQRGNSDEVDGSSRARFRNSKLTLLLSNALAGNSKTCLLGTLSPAAVNLDESYVTLNFASTVKSIKVTAKRVAKVDKDSLIQSLNEELRSLKDQLNSATPRNAQDLDSQAGFIRNMMESYKARWEEAQKNADLLRRQKDDALQNLAISRWRFARATVKNELRDEARADAAIEQLHLQGTPPSQGTQSNGASPVSPESFEVHFDPHEPSEHRLPETGASQVESMRYQQSLSTNSAEMGAWLSHWRTPAASDSPMWPPIPSLVIYSKDPSFSGRLIFHAEEEGRRYVLGCSSRCDFQLPQTPGICPETCLIWQESGRLFLKPLGIILLPSAAIEVNGTRLVRAEAKELLHQDFVVLGQSFRFFVFTKPDPTVQALLFSGRAEEGANDESTNAAIRGIIAERACSPLEMERARRYLRALEEDMVSSTSSKDEFLKRAMQARNMIEDAKVFSKALRPHDGLSYELLTLSPVLSLHELGTPSLCIRVLKNANLAPTEVALWSFSTFQSRLNLMKNAYNRTFRPATPATDDPWREMTAFWPVGAAGYENHNAQLQHPVAINPPIPVPVYRTQLPAATTLSPQWRTPIQPFQIGFQAVPSTVSYRIPSTPAPSCTSSPRTAARSVRNLEQAASASPSTRYREI
ncbi:Kinesin-like protein KIF1A [Symbiodinium microadriaticum]|uniref:Kinesin-like protein KIF1A n=1 Tax=Symbiodinium microadriaticum TaxID=2951 RepID=A0A1Q9D237_SYMMI|nr:Kinesin-like protein KIF1A [Symbiodinium microadriaticum]